ncbi:MAG: leucine-rich repeat protein [Oscillospiraceae bacterium]|jgi:hypothetical protein|nr:leucine-rich repeat protein [Oscillospiraceae bacterium]
MKKISKMIVFLLIMLLCVAPLEAFAAGNYNDFQYEFIQDGSEIQITGYTGSATTVTIPGSISGHPVTSIKDSCFKNKDFIQDFVIPPSVKHFGDYAFAGTKWLSNYKGDFVIVNKVLIKYKGDSTSKEVVPDDVEVIGYGAFDFSKFQEIVLPDGLSAIFSDAFYECANLKFIQIPASVSYIGPTAFARCFALENILVVKENMVFSSSGGALLDKAQQNLILCPMGKTGTYTVPATVKTIGIDAFLSCAKLSAVVLPEGLLEISRGAFSKCDALASIKIPNSVTKIGYWAFGECAALKEVTLGSGLTDIDDMAFISLPNLKKVQVSDRVKKIGDYAFGYIYNWDSKTVSRVSGFQIAIDNHDDVKYTDSSIMKYARDNKFSFSFVRDVVRNMGDVSGNGKVEAEDARLALRASAKLITLSPHAKTASDADKNGSVTASDARTILRVAAGLTSFR